MTTLTPNLILAGCAATKLKEQQIVHAGRHLSLAAAGSATAGSAAVHREIAEEYALAAAAARLEADDLSRLHQAGCAQ